ncbi:MULTISPECIES: cyanase [unclassified Psychrobacter]|jgi:cyanate lyase|uniref:cyanase n=1 Tax=Psychrobacter TaxID=497 RepID=UPI000C340B29|nr:MULTISPECIES: cyanase [unclassified Psychrobacter]MBA6243265.1 cyanase [Psychrobacter sp. Urea-trap-18]MBA6285029.1 cyanase [Psychrobacter sp. Urea-trap-16]MBA6333674.1 cyanase [Psychrobacter sp. Urea-trap-19]PKG61715.1 cyanase [Psychrobacter sp. Choline-3u-12]PKG61946.1 cyanase [Psychrobacter sp. Choline-02u-13]|tara:strand:- start:3589 stop:4029 length:441 start_codon:yes stop_codon:yes gene_type:complete
MTREELTEAIILAKKEKALSWEDIAAYLEMGVVWVTSACFGNNSMPEAPASKLCSLLELTDQAKTTLMEYPTKSWGRDVPQDPLVYRLYEAVGIYGTSIKEVVQEKFGDGIMSAIDFSIDIDKEENPNGDRVVIVLNGKFLPYKTW